MPNSERAWRIRKLAGIRSYSWTFGGASRLGIGVAAPLLNPALGLGQPDPALFDIATLGLNRRQADPVERSANPQMVDLERLDEQGRLVVLPGTKSRECPGIAIPSGPLGRLGFWWPWGGDPAAFVRLCGSKALLELCLTFEDFRLEIVHQI